MRITTINELKCNGRAREKIADSLIDDIISVAYHRLCEYSDFTKFRIKYKITPLEDMKGDYK